MTLQTAIFSQKAQWEATTKFYGLHHIIEEIGEVAYNLDLPPEAMINNVFHISQLKLKLGRNQQVHTSPALTEEFELQVEPVLGSIGTAR